MPRRDDLKRILVIGAGPIVIGQACEFDYSGTQACKALRSEGLQVILVNSNPATIMTDPEMADRTYIEPLTVEAVTKVIEKEKPDAILPTVGGQTALNLAVSLHEAGVLDKYNVQLIGASVQAIKVGEDRLLFREAMEDIGVDVPASGLARSLDEAVAIVKRTGFPSIIRPSFTMGGVGGGIAYNVEEFRELVERGLEMSPVHELLIEESVIGWKEFELEVMRDVADNFVVICSIENIDPMGVHTGDSITVAPALTLTDKEYQRMRDAARRIIRRVGVETGGSNIQFAVNPKDGRMLAIEMNPRVSRSSALASKATGFPIAKIAAKLALGYHLDEIPNDITRLTPASFEPTIDYVVVKFPRWNFEKFPQADRTLTTQMKSVGEAMAIGRTFKEAFLKGVRSLELGKEGLLLTQSSDDEDDSSLRKKLVVPNDRRMWALFRALERGWTVEQLHELTKIDPWFLQQFSQISELRRIAGMQSLRELSTDVLRTLKRAGFGDIEIAAIYAVPEATVRERRLEAELIASYKRIDTCAAEFESFTPYMYGTYEKGDESNPNAKSKVVILGSGPNRIGQGLEFDYCCCHAAFALRDAGFETVMINCNPETVSTDYDTSDRLYFEPLTHEDVLNVIEAETEAAGGVAPKVIVSLGGQTPLKLSGLLPAEMVAGTSPRSIDLAEDREKWNELCESLHIPQPPGGTATSLAEADVIVDRIGYPVLVRPSYVLGGRAMRIVDDHGALVDAMQELDGFGSLGKEGGLSKDRPVLIDRFLEDATEVDVDAIRDHTGDVLIGGVMEHVEEAGVHSGDSACALPPQTLQAWVVEVIEAYTRSIAHALDVRGPINVQYAVRHNQVFVIEANPRASRTVPFVAKATGVPLAKVASRVMLGATLAELRSSGVLPAPVTGGHVSVKEAVLPFSRFPEVDSALGPEMRSTGEVMGIASSFGLAFSKAETAAGTDLPTSGTVFLSLADRDKPAGLIVARRLQERGLRVVATQGTADYLARFGMTMADDQRVAKLSEGTGTSAVDLINAGKIDFVINTPSGSGARADGYYIRRAANLARVGSVTTVAASLALVAGLAAREAAPLTVRSLQEYHAGTP